MEFFSISLSKEKMSMEFYKYIFWKDPNIYENYLFPKTVNISKSKVNIFDTDHHKNARLKDSIVF